ncbi:L-lactate permease [Micrococcus flavus]|uniref:L-lactate permease n=1 Tax=Micrococcus flavus TaxID=384602 RepID=A0A4Y8X2P0_9MICC|nr:L-lactate permease [Micrococcus flavus]MBB4881885.1 lactate permease [Micrococcus flavus]TFI03572.1 L-lactate permease [Micrococcus flavus]GGK45689.1 L-lactate permease [Micrococcus flavus]
MQTYSAVPDAAGSLGLSAALGVLPLLTFFITLMLLKLKAWQSGLAALAVALGVAVVGFGMPAELALLSATQGAAFGLFPIVWIVVMALWFYQVTVLSGRFEDMRAIFDSIGGGDIRIQAVLIAFCFGGLLEALAGFGAPVAITATMILALGIPPLRAATAVLLANTAPVAFGAVGIPITTAGTLTGIPAEHIGAIVGHQAPFVAILVPFLLVLIIDGARGVRQTWPALLVIGAAFALSIWFASTYFSYELTDVVAALVSMGTAVVMLRFWRPKGAAEARARLGVTDAPTASTLTPVRVWMALLPYIVVVTVFGLAKLVPPITAALSSATTNTPWPGLDGRLVDTAGAPIANTMYKAEWLASPGTLLLFAGLVMTVVYSVFDEGGRYRLGMGDAVAEIGRSFWRMRWSALTIMTVLSLAYVMNFSGQTIAMGTWVAGLGTAFVFLSPVLGWLGTAVTGSDTSANALFAKLQQTAAHNIGADPALLVAANTSGGVVGKMISPQSLAIAATAVSLEGRESEILRRVVGWSVGLLLLVCVIVYLQSTVLSWMLPAAP